jgi:hypothetical protein
MDTNANRNLPSQTPKATKLRLTLYVFYLCMGFAGAARQLEGNESTFGVVSSVSLILCGVVSASALVYGYVTGKLP